MINQEEYKILKKCDDKWKWIARDGVKGELNVYSVRPTRSCFKNWWFTNKWCGYSKIVPTDLFQFVQWEDEEPHSIAELIEEYEGGCDIGYTSEEYAKYIIKFSEKLLTKLEDEKMKKDKEWLKSWFSDGKMVYSGEYINYIIDGMDELEVLSQEWIDKNVVYVRGLGDIIEAEAVENLLVPKPEKVVIPQFVADHIEFCKSKNKRLNAALSESPEIRMVSEMGVSWEEASEIYARAWLDGFTVEEEPLYYAKIKGHELVNDSEDGYWNVDGNELYIDNNWHDCSGYKTTKLTKYDWNNLGINEDNADFVKVEEVE